MTEYIERELAVRCLEEHMTKTAQAGSKLMKSVYLMAKDHAIDYLNIIPTADVVEVRHAHWIESDNLESFNTRGWKRYKKVICSNCQKSNYNNHSNYCPHCGADMRGEKNGKE